MMGRQRRDRGRLFYEFRLEDRIPENHLLRRINVFVTAALADLHNKLEPHYSDRSRWLQPQHQESAKVLTEVAETAWGSTKMLNEKLAQNLTANIEASFTAAHAIAKAQSLPEALKLHTEFFQKLAAQTAEQTKEFFDLSTRATQHVFEQVQAAAAKAMKPAA